MNKIKKFILNVKQEMIKVSWPTRDELLNSTSVVLISTALLAVFTYAVDAVFTIIIGMVIK